MYDSMSPNFPVTLLWKISSHNLICKDETGIYNSDDDINNI